MYVGTLNQMTLLNAIYYCRVVLQMDVIQKYIAKLKNCG